MSDLYLESRKTALIAIDLPNAKGSDRRRLREAGQVWSHSRDSGRRGPPGSHRREAYRGLRDSEILFDHSAHTRRVQGYSRCCAKGHEREGSIVRLRNELRTVVRIDEAKVKFDKGEIIRSGAALHLDQGEFGRWPEVALIPAV
jgi:hypothetical protein